MATQPINTALCAFGMSGWVFHAPFLQLHPGFNLYAVWERSKKLAQEKYPQITSHNTLEELLKDDTVELVVVNTPSYSHYEYAKKALQAGKHVIVEKPFTATVAEAEELAALAEKQQKKLSVYQNRRYDSDFKTVKKIIEKGVLGDMVDAEIHYDRYSVDLSPKKHKEIPGPAVGIVYDLGSHLIDQALQLFGMPQAVFGDIATRRPVATVSDYFEILLYYPTFRVRLKSSYHVREPLPGFIMHGTIGSFLKTRADVQEILLQAGESPGKEDWGREPEREEGLLHTEKDGKQVREKVPTEPGNYGEYYEGIYQAIRHNKKLPVTAEDGINVIRIIEAVNESNQSSKVIRLDDGK